MALGWAIVSTGRHPDRKMAPAITAAKDASIVAVYSRERETADAFAQKHGAKRAYTSVEDLLRDPEVDAVYIASPNHLHAPYTIQAAQAGKHVLSEKPLTLTVEDAVEMVRACRRANVHFGTAFHLRHHPGHQRAREIIQAGATGVIALMSAMWGGGQRGVVHTGERTGRERWWTEPEKVGAGAMMGTGVHALDLLRWVSGKEAVEVFAYTDGQNPERPLEDLGAMTIRYEDGTIGQMVCSRRIPDPRNDLNVYGSEGRVSVLGSLNTVLQGTLDVQTGSVTEEAAYGPDDVAMYTRMVESFGEAVARGEEPSASGLDGLRIVELTNAYIKSAQTGRPVKIERAQV